MRYNFIPPTPLNKGRLDGPPLNKGGLDGPPLIKACTAIRLTPRYAIDVSGYCTSTTLSNRFGSKGTEPLRGGSRSVALALWWLGGIKLLYLIAMKSAVNTQNRGMARQWPRIVGPSALEKNMLVLIQPFLV
jgi:hypothetical protein